MSGNAHPYKRPTKDTVASEEEAGDTIESKETKPMSDDMIDDDFLVDVPDIPMPEEDAGIAKEVIQDEFYKDEDSPGAAFKFAFIGCGQGGSRIAESFYKLGYRRVCAVNTTNQDLKSINIPDTNKLVIGEGEGGAGKNPANGARIANSSYDDIYDLMKRSFGTDFDRIFVCVGAGGGTGSGSADVVIEVAHDLARSSKKEKDGGEPVVGAIASMPKLSEGDKVNANAYTVLESLFRQVGTSGKLGGRTLSPLVVVDNDRINKIYPNLPVAKFWDMANRNISSLFHLFNSIAIKDSEFTTFDRADFKDLLQSGVVSFGACPVRNWENESGISHAIRDNLKNNVLVGGLDLRQSRKAGCIFIASSDVLDRIPQSNLEHGFEGLKRTMQSGGTIHRGIYKGSKSGLVAYTLMGELGSPTERMEEIAKEGRVAIKKK